MKAIPFIGRKEERKVLEEALNTREAEMISVIGRRRVGKTFLIRTVYKDRISFEISGIQNAQGDEQLRNFVQQIKEFFPSTKLKQTPKDWLDAFFVLIEHLKTVSQKEKIVVFFDELPWLSTHKSGFLRALSYFWNSWAEKQNIVVVLCGSAASWMIKKILRNKGGLHNRVTKRLRLKPFTLTETEDYLRSRNVFIDRYQLLQIYMAMGGIPHYLKEIKNGKSAVQNINQICFSEDGLLQDEFESLYPALFDSADYHTAIIRALAEKQNGLSRSEISTQANLPEGGNISRVLLELEESGFISAYRPYGKRKKGTVYRLTDEYSLFYIRFIEKNKMRKNTNWIALSQTQGYKIWSGYAFENICLKHIENVKKALGIEGIHSVSSSFLQKGTGGEQGAQIDLLIDHNDHVINLIETKFYNTEFTISKEYAARLREKMRVFQEATQTKKHLMWTLITAFGIHENQHSIGLVAQELTIEDLF